MGSGGTKEVAEAVLRELPSVVGAFVREDHRGHPREVHLLIVAGPNPGHFARDVRDLLEERLGIPVDQRVISVAQLAARQETLEGAPPPASSASGFALEADPETLVEPALFPEPRIRYLGNEVAVQSGRLQVRVTLAWEGTQSVGEAAELDGPTSPVRAGAVAALAAASALSAGPVRFELEMASVVSVLNRPHALITAHASAPTLGRRPVLLAGAHPLEEDAPAAGALAALKAINRLSGMLLRIE